MFACTAGIAGAATPVFHHTFDSADDQSGTYQCTAQGGATFEKVDGEGILNLGANGGWFDFGESFGNLINSLTGDFSISLTLNIPSETALGANGNFIFNFGNSNTTGYMFFGANESRLSITPASYQNEQTVNAGTAFPKGEWVVLTIVRSGNNVSIWFGNEMKKEGSVEMTPSQLGKTVQNWLGRSPYSGDVLLKNAMYSDFKLYDTALTPAEISELANNETINALNAESHKQQLEAALAGATFNFKDLRHDISLPSVIGNNVKVTWESDNAAISSTGKVTRPAVGQPEAVVTLTATAVKGNQSKTQTYQANVLPLYDDKTSVELDLAALKLKGNLNNLRGDLDLIATTLEGSKITWATNKPETLTATGKLMKLAETEADRDVILTATATRGGETASREFPVKVALPETHDSYLFTFFPSNENENLYYALSRDGFNFTVLNNDKCVMSSDTVALKKGIRDPHILRGVDGKTFLMVATDMKSAEGWNSNRGMVLYKSTDLVHWTHSAIHFPDRFPEWKNVTRVWAPEVIWDPDYTNTDGSKGRYLVYFSLLTNDGKCTYDKIYYCYANDDFTDFITDPVYFYDRGSATIDGDIVYNESDGKYHMFFKNEALGGICKVTADRLTHEPGSEPGSQWSKPSRTMQMTNEAVEGAGLFRLINSDTWILMYDCYMNGHYQFCSSTNLEDFTLRAQTTTSGAFTPRHGTVIALTPEETARLLEAFPPKSSALKVLSSNSRNTRTDNVKITSTSVYVPVRYGTDLKSFDPELQPSFGATITPTGPQDFTAGKVTYTLTNATASKDITVEVAVEANPVLPGFNADPEVLYSKKTGKFYIYPTSDGYPSWGGFKFYAWSSDDLVNWTREECILDLSGDQVSWATGDAWAPSIEEKLEDGEYKYYFYFSGNNPSFGRKTLGCAIADSPTGPFRDLGHPLIDTNITGGQLIDSDVFTDPTDGQTYFYWGNGALVASKLTPDMTTISDAKVITPSGGSLDTYAFREGVYVIYREGLYYFLWSVDDTGADNYHVAYGTSTSPMGPITVAKKPIVIQRDTKTSIYGTGHNSVIQIPGRDEWYIVYHRINKNFRNNGPGYHREVCIDRLEFDENGLIVKATPTHTGITPVDLNGTGVNEIEMEASTASVVASEYYDLQGIRMQREPSDHGMFIRRDTMSNGRTRALKIAK